MNNASQHNMSYENSRTMPPIAASENGGEEDVENSDFEDIDEENETR